MLEAERNLLQEKRIRVETLQDRKDLHVGYNKKVQDIKNYEGMYFNGKDFSYLYSNKSYKSKKVEM